jgi:hypothetical protein
MKARMFTSPVTGSYKVNRRAPALISAKSAELSISEHGTVLVLFPGHYTQGNIHPSRPAARRLRSTRRPLPTKRN